MQRKVHKTPKRKLHTAAKKATKSKKVKKVATFQQKRNGHVALDAQGRVLPTNYDTVHYHDPYDYFIPAASPVFDENYFIRPALAAKYFGADAAEGEIDEANPQVIKGMAKVGATMKEFQDATLAHGATITCEKEKAIYEKTFGYMANPKRLSTEEQKKAAQDAGYASLDQVTNDAFDTTWTKFFTHDLTYGTPKDKAMYIAAAAVVGLSTAALTYEAIDASLQFFYDIQYPLHSDH